MTPATGTLYVVPNTLDLGCAPGDLHDALPLGALRVAARLRHWIVEDAKAARAFLKRIDAVVPIGEALRSIDIAQLPRPAKGRLRAAGGDDPSSLLEPVLAGEDAGLLSEAGLPGVADPGAAVVAAAHRHDLRVVALAGASAITLGIAASGLQGQSFAFVGYLPTEPGARSERLRELEALSRRMRQTQLFIETPYRNAVLLEAILAALAPSTLVSISVGLTLAGGWSRTLTVAQWKARHPQLPNDVPAVFALQAR